jgi:xylulokinase
VSSTAGAGALLLGVDLGTTGAKALVVDPSRGHAEPVADGYAPYPSAVGPDGRHEQDPEDWWDAAVRAVHAALQQVPSGRVAAVGLSGHMHAVAPVDVDGAAIRPAMTWADRRAAPQADALVPHAALFAQRCANPVVPAFPAARIRWLADHEPQALAAARWLVQPKDLLRHRLTGTWGTDVSDAAGTLLFDVHARRWDPELWALVGADPRLAPPVQGSTQVVGTVTAAAATATGLHEGTPVVAGAGDVACAALGAGLVAPGRVYVNTGTAAQVMAPSRTPAPGRGFVFAQAVGRGYLTMASVYAAGMSVRWMERDVLELADGSAGALDGAAEPAPPGAGGVVYLPFLLGASAPVHDPTVRAGFLGIGPEHGRAHLARAVIEGVAFACLDSAAEVQRASGEQAPGTAELLVGGGGARSPVLRDVLAACAGTPVRRLDVEASPMGAALLAGLGVGVWADVGEATATVGTSAVRRPGEAATAAYRRSRERYREAVRVVVDLAASPAWRNP